MLIVVLSYVARSIYFFIFPDFMSFSPIKRSTRYPDSYCIQSYACDFC